MTKKFGNYLCIASNCEIAYKEVQQHDKIIKNQEIRLARIEKSGVSVSTTAAPPHDFSEYLMMLDRSTVSRSSISSVAKNVEFLVPVDMIKLFEVNSKEVALNDKANTFEISGKKILIYFNQKFRTRIELIRVLGQPRWRSIKLCISLQFTTPFNARLCIDNRQALKINDDSKKNPSLNRAIVGAQQKCHNMLSEMKKDNRIKDLFISKAGFVNYTLVDPENGGKDFVRTVLDANEVLYWYSREEVVDLEIVKSMQSGLFFINSRLELTGVPARFRARKDPEADMKL